MSLKEILEGVGLPAQRGIYTAKEKPEAFYTFLRLLKDTAINADDKSAAKRELYRVTLFHKSDFETQLAKTLEALRAAGAYINSVDTESYEIDTGYWAVPITLELLKEEQ